MIWDSNLERVGYHRPALLARLIRGLYGTLSKDTVVVLIRACIDESSTSKDDLDAPMLLCGTVARVSRWDMFDRSWGKMLKREHLEYIRAKDLVKGSGQFTGWTQQRRAALADRCARRVLKDVEFSFCTVLDKHDFGVYRDGGKELNTILDSDYGLSVRLALSFLLVAIPQLIPAKEHAVYLVVEEGHPNSGAARDLLAKMHKEIPNCIIRSVAYVEKEDCYGTQAADMLAYSILTAHERLSKGDFKDIPKEKLKEGAPSDGRPPTYRLPLTPAILADLRKTTILSKGTYRKRFGHLIPS